MDLEKLEKAISILKKYGNTKVSIQKIVPHIGNEFNTDDYIVLSEARSVSEVHTDLLKDLGVKWNGRCWRTEV